MNKKPTSRSPNTAWLTGWNDGLDALEAEQAQEARTALEQYDLDQSADYQKGWNDGRIKGYEVGHRYATEAKQAQASLPATHKTTGWVAPVDRYAVPVLFNPYTGEPRDVRDVQSDPQGVLIVPPGKVEMLAAKPTVESVTDCMMNLVDRLGHEASDVDARAWEHLLVYAPKQAQAVELTRLADRLADQKTIAGNWKARALKAQQVAVPMSGDEMWSLWNSQGIDEMTQLQAVAFARAIEAHHGIGAKPVTKPDSKTDWSAA